MAEKFFYDCEFLEGSQRKRLLGIPYSKTKPTIDLISIGMIDKDGNEFYAISKEFNLEEAWGRYDVIEGNTSRNHSLYDIRVYWIRDNVLKPIFDHLCELEFMDTYEYPEFTYKSMKRLLASYGDTNENIARDLKNFVYKKFLEENPVMSSNHWYPRGIEFYGYYSAYDHVCLSWLYGKMINLPSGFPMYTRDLKQMIDEKADRMLQKYNYENRSLALDILKSDDAYPKEENEHSAIDDARFNRNLYQFLEKLS